MATRIEIVDPLQYAGVASQILQAAWKPPCLRYSADYLAWQFSFPSHLPRRGAIALLDDRAVGCIGVTTRRFMCAGNLLSAYVLSFVAVDPSASRRGLAAAMYASLLDALPLEIPVLAFTEPASIGERLLLDSFARASFRHRSLQACRATGYLARQGSTPSRSSGAAALEADSYKAYASAHQAPAEGNIVWTDITREDWEHYRQDPRERTMVTVRDAAGNSVGTAMFVSAEIISSQGVQRVPMLDGVDLRGPTAETLAALFGFAASRSQPGSTVVASNLSYIDAGVIRAAGARALPSSFNAHAFARGKTTIVEGADALNLEVT